MKSNKVITIGLTSLLLFALSQRFSWLVPIPKIEAKCSESGSFESGPKKVHLIELYTSEGCSSCPPAEKWLNSLYDSKNLYKAFIPVAFHVDYWNYLGHPDPYSSKSFSNRQRAYANQWKSRNVYTPGFVKDGNEWRSFSRSAPNEKGGVVGNLKVKPLKDDRYEISFDSKKKNYRVYGSILLHGLENKIRRGENRGKVLRHNFVVNDLQVSSLKDGKATLKLKSKDRGQKDQSIVFWVTEGNSLAPIQAAGRCLKI